MYTYVYIHIREMSTTTLAASDRPASASFPDRRRMGERLFHMLAIMMSGATSEGKAQAKPHKIITEQSDCTLYMSWLVTLLATPHHSLLSKN